MDTDTLIKTVIEMRKHQIAYFRTKSKDALRYSRDAEKRIDEMLHVYQIEQLEKRQTKIEF